MVDHGHVARLDPGDELLRPTVDPCPAPGLATGPGRTEPKQLGGQCVPSPARDRPGRPSSDSRVAESEAQVTAPAPPTRGRLCTEPIGLAEELLGVGDGALAPREPGEHP